MKACRIGQRPLACAGGRQTPVNILYTAPTAIRALMAEGDKAIEGTDRSSLRILGSVGEPINPEAWEWYWKKIGKEKCPVVDTGGRLKQAVL